MTRKMEYGLTGPPAVLVWYGDDPVVFGAILAALKENKISAHDMAAHSQLIKRSEPFQGPCYSILVPADQADEARKIISELMDSSSREI
jgi:hypothetical protein